MNLAFCDRQEAADAMLSKGHTMEMDAPWAEHIAMMAGDLTGDLSHLLVGEQFVCLFKARYTY